MFEFKELKIDQEKKDKKVKLTIGMAHYDDYDGAYFTIQDIRKELIFNGHTDLLNEIEFLIVDNNPGDKHCESLKRFAKNHVTYTSNVKFIEMKDNVGTSVTRNKIIEKAEGDFVLVMDCHILLCPVVDIITKIFKFIEDNPHTKDLYTGPLTNDNMIVHHTHFNDSWGSGMWGSWGLAWMCPCGFYFSPLSQNGNNDIEYVTLVGQKCIKQCPDCNTDLPEIKHYGHENKLEELGYVNCGKQTDSFEIFAQGLGLFFTRQSSWLGFNEHCRGFGGEECYIHEKYRAAGRKTICLPFLKWLHRFDRPNGVKYPLTYDCRVRNYILEFTELGLDMTPLLLHFKDFDKQKMDFLIKEAETLYR